MKKTLIGFLQITSLLLILTACGNKEAADANKPEAKMSEKPQVVLEEKAEVQASTNTELQEATEEMLKLGTRSFIRCRSCHTLSAKEPHTVGPNLNGLFSSIAGKKEGFNYSPALAESNIKWNAETLRKWLRSPSTYIPGNKMAFAGVVNDKELEALLVYLNENTK